MFSQAGKEEKREFLGRKNIKISRVQKQAEKNKSIIMMTSVIFKSRVIYFK